MPRLEVEVGPWQLDHNGLTMTANVAWRVYAGSARIDYGEVKANRLVSLAALAARRVREEAARLARLHLTVTADGGGSE
jgi:hypothetical protein